MKAVRMLLQNKEKAMSIKIFSYIVATLFIAQQQLFTSEIKIKNGTLTLAHNQTHWIFTSAQEPRTIQKTLSLEEGTALIIKQQQKDHATISRIRARETSCLESLNKSVKEHADDLEWFCSFKRKIEAYIKLLEAHYTCNLARVAAGFEPRPLDMSQSTSQEITQTSQQPA